MSQLTQNTTDLDALIAKANALPDAGSGGGTLETCTVRPYLINGSYMGYTGDYAAIVFRDGKLSYVTGTWNATDITADNPITDVVCNSIFFLNVQSRTVQVHGGAALLFKNSYSSCYSMPNDSGADVQLFASGELAE